MSGGGGWGSCREAEQKTQSCMFRETQTLRSTDTELIGMVREGAGEVMWNQTVQGSYFVLRVMTGSWKDLKWKSDLFRIAF